MSFGARPYVRQFLQSSRQQYFSTYPFVLYLRLCSVGEALGVSVPVGARGFFALGACGAWRCSLSFFSVGYLMHSSVLPL